MIKRSLTAVALATVLAAPAFAQTPAQPQMPPANNNATINSQTSMPNQNMAEKGAGFVQNQSASEWRGSKLIGASVYGPDNQSIGEINDVIIASDGSIKAAVVGVGGFLGVGEKDVALPFQALQVTRKPNSESIDKVTVSYSKDELKNAPKFAFFDGSSAQTTGSSTGATPMSPATDASRKPMNDTTTKK
jgi:hypothetical protein